MKDKYYLGICQKCSEMKHLKNGYCAECKEPKFDNIETPEVIKDIFDMLGINKDK